MIIAFNSVRTELRRLVIKNFHGVQIMIVKDLPSQISTFVSPYEDIYVNGKQCEKILIMIV